MYTYITGMSWKHVGLNITISVPTNRREKKRTFLTTQIKELRWLQNVGPHKIFLGYRAAPWIVSGSSMLRKHNKGQ